MRQIHALHFKLLPLAAHYEFFSNLSVWLLTAGEAVKQMVAALMPALQSWLEKETAVISWVRKSVLTGEIAEADRRIDHALVGINAAVTAALYAPDEETVATARRLHVMLKNYGRVAAKSYDEEAGDVQVLLEQFTGSYAPDITAIGMTDRVAELQTAFDNFERLLRRRADKQATKPSCTGKEARKGIEAVYRKMVVLINAGSAVGLSDDFIAFVDYLNPYIDRLNAEFAKTRQDISAADIEPIEIQYYTGQPLTPVPVVYYATPHNGTVRLEPGKDYNLTYRHNVHTGNAQCIVQGKGSYRGSKTITFNIEQIQ